MANPPLPTHIFVGAARSRSETRGGVFRQAIGDDRWEHLTKGLPVVTDVQAITVHPASPEVIYLGTRSGPYRSTDRGERWERLGFPDDTEVWSILVHPTNPRTLYAGTSPVGVYRSDDGGDTWRRLPKATQPERVKMKSFVCRVMRLAADPARPDELYGALEVGGVMKSPDAGETWQDCSADLVRLAELPHLKSRIDSDTDIEGMLDGHALCLSAARPGTVFLAVRMGLFRSAERGAHWQTMDIGRFSPLTYSRDLRVSPHDPRVLYACLSPAARSQDGSLYRSRDLGETWTRVDHGVKAESTMMAVALHPRDPGQRGGREHDHRAAGRPRRRAHARRVATPNHLQPRRDVPLLPHRGTGHEAPARRQDREHLVHRRAGAQREQQQRLRRGQGRDHRLHPEARARAGAVRRHRQRHRPKPDADRTHPAAVGAADPGRADAGNRPHAAPPGRRGARPGTGDLLPRLPRR